MRCQGWGISVRRELQRRKNIAVFVKNAIDSAINNAVTRYRLTLVAPVVSAQQTHDHYARRAISWRSRHKCIAQ